MNNSFQVKKDLVIDLYEVAWYEVIHIKATFKRAIVFNLKNGVKILAQFEDGKELTECRERLYELVKYKDSSIKT